MSSEVSLLNKYSRWIEIKFNGVMFYLKGNVFFNKNLLSPDKWVELLYPLVGKEDKIQEKEIGKFLKELNGEFAIIVETKSEILCAVDKVRSIPLFYTTVKDSFIISDSACFLKDKSKSHFNEINAAELLLTGFVTGNVTLFDGIKQVRNGEFLIYQKKERYLKNSFYFKFLHENYYELSESQLLTKLDDIFVSVFSRLIESTEKQGKKLIVPLSGGLDSRIIVAMLKRLGVNDVTCISYGGKGNRQSMISKKVAKALGYDWLFVKYTASKWHECYNSEEANSFQVWAGNLASMPHMQDFLALRELKNQGKLPENSVFVPGHSGDMLAGSHIPHYYLDASRNYDSETFLIDSLRKHYILWKWPSEYEFEHIFREKIKKSIDAMEINNNETCANAVELFDFNERQSKFIVNSIRAYEFFGYEWRIPFWDTELINFFLKIPIEQRIGQNLYKKYARDLLFSGELSVLKNIDCTTDILNPKPLDKRSKYEKLLFYRKFIHSYYDEKINNPVWGRYFENPLISRFRLKVSRCETKNIEEYPLLKMIVEYRNKEMYPLSVNAITTLEYLASIKGENHLSREKIVLKPIVPLLENVSE